MSKKPSTALKISICGSRGRTYAMIPARSDSQLVCSMKRILPLVLVLMAAFGALAAGQKPNITSPNTATGTEGIAFTYQITATQSPTSYGTTVSIPGVSFSGATGLFSGTPTTAGTYSGNITATNANGADSATLTVTINPAPDSKFLRIVYDWSGQSSTSYLGTATTFTPPNPVRGIMVGGTISGQTILPVGGVLPAAPGTLYFINNTPAPAVGSSSVDVLVGAARQAGAWTGTSVPVTCAADWSPKYAIGGTATLTVTSFDSTQNILQNSTKTITPGSNAVPSTPVATITYNADGTFTLP
jgi:hypothetical protein